MFSFLKAVLAVYYVTRFMLLYERDSHEGPFINPEKFVVFLKENENGHFSHFQKFGLWDRIRHLAGVTQQEGDLFYVKDTWKTDLFTCPHCLNWWIAFMVSIPYLFKTKNIIKTVKFHFAVSGAVSILFTLADHLQERGDIVVLYGEENAEDEDYP